MAYSDKKLPFNVIPGNMSWEGGVSGTGPGDAASKQGPQEREETQSFETLVFPALWVASGHRATWLVEAGQ